MNYLYNYKAKIGEKKKPGNLDFSGKRVFLFFVEKVLIWSPI